MKLLFREIRECFGDILELLQILFILKDNNKTSNLDDRREGKKIGDVNPVKLTHRTRCWCLVFFDGLCVACYMEVCSAHEAAPGGCGPLLNPGINYHCPGSQALNTLSKG